VKHPDTFTTDGADTGRTGNVVTVDGYSTTEVASTEIPTSIGVFTFRIRSKNALGYSVAYSANSSSVIIFSGITNATAIKNFSDNINAK